MSVHVSPSCCISMVVGFISFTVAAHYAFFIFLLRCLKIEKLIVRCWDWRSDEFVFASVCFSNSANSSGSAEA